MDNKPVNALNVNLMQELQESIDEANVSDCEGIILTSSCRIFSAGLDLTELHDASPEFLTEFWTTFQNLCYSLYSSPKCTVAEIGGHAPAAGTIISLCCDMRIAVPGATVGLNESAFGLVCPTWACEMMVDNVGQRVAYAALSQGLLFPSEKALAMGLVDKVVDDPATLTQTTQEECLKWTSKPGRAALKAALRGPVTSRWKGDQAKDLQAFLDVLTAPVTQKRIGDYLQSLSAAKKKK